MNILLLSTFKRIKLIKILRGLVREKIILHDTSCTAHQKKVYIYMFNHKTSSTEHNNGCCIYN